MQVNIEGPTTKTVNNALVAIVGIDDYHQNPNWKPLNGVINDVEKSIKLWSEYFCYDTTILANRNDEKHQNNQNRTKIYHKDIFTFMLNNVRNPLKQYDALIFMLFGHGYNEALITSDCTPVYYDEIRSYFDAVQVGADWAAASMRLFIIDTCRGADDATVLTIPSRGRSYNPNTVNNDSNICTYYATTKSHAIGDQNVFMNTVDLTMRKMDLDEYTLYDIITKIASVLRAKESSWYCPEFATTNKFKIKLKPRTNVKKGNVTYYELTGEEQNDDQITVWTESKDESQDTKPKSKTWWHWYKAKIAPYGRYIAVVMALILFYYAGKLSNNSNFKFVFPIRSPIEWDS